MLWKKLKCETGLPSDVVSIFKYWYDNQRNCVKWAGSHSVDYGLKCGMRQGGLTSPRLFNLYINKLIEGLSSTYIGCHVGGVCFNSISYADDMVLLSPSIGALRKLLHMCEEYAVNHGLRYNSLKSEFMVFQAGAARSHRGVSGVALGGSVLKRVDRFKYLGHWVTESLSDSLDIERERRALSVRCNMLIHRFARCSKQAKLTLFKAYCQSFYTCGLWVDFTQRAYSALRVQYNNAFRMLFGLPRFCSASSMFAEARTACFNTIIRKRCGSLWARMHAAPSTVLSTLAVRWDFPLIRRWSQLQAPVANYYCL
jgi:hypothetical protein